MQTTIGLPTPESGTTPRFSLSPAVQSPARRIPSSPAQPAMPNRIAPPQNNGSHCGARTLIEALTRSKIYQEYERAFSEATGLPMTLRPVECWQLPLHGKHHESPYCALMSSQSRVCAACLQLQERLSQSASQAPQTIVCPAGLCESAVPVRLGDRVIGFLMTGQVFAKKPTTAQFDRTAEMVAKWGVKVDREQMREAYFATQVVSPKKQESARTLLQIFAQHLSMLSNQVVVQQENAEPPVITKAKDYIREHQTEDLRLGQVAKAVNTSTYYFCKMFKKVAGVNFTDYLSRIRIEKSKNLLLNPNLRISEIAYEVGFQSLTHFNRTFKKLLGQSPSEYRARLRGVGEIQ